MVAAAGPKGIHICFIGDRNGYETMKWWWRSFSLNADTFFDISGEKKEKTNKVPNIHSNKRNVSFSILNYCDDDCIYFSFQMIIIYVEINTRKIKKMTQKNIFIIYILYILIGKKILSYYIYFFIM